MSSSQENPTRPLRLSLATRLTLWYAGTAFVIAFLAIGALYIVLERSLERETDVSLMDRLQDFKLVLRNATDMSSQDLQDELTEEASIRRVTPIYYRVIDDDGSLQGESAGFQDVVDSHLFPKPVISDNPPIIAVTSRSGVPLRITSLYVVEPGEGGKRHVVQAAMNVSWNEKLLVTYRQRLWMALACVLVASVAGGYQIARRGMRPIREITLTARSVGSAEMGARIDASQMPAEVASVAVEFNAMLDRLKTFFERLERFSADIAHELRTPVNNIRSATQIALSRPRSQAEYRDIIENISEELDRLIRIIESLLFLARAEDPRHQIRPEPLNLTHELEIVRDFYEIAASEAGVMLAVESPAIVEGKVDRTLFQRAVGNLIQNAIVHTPRGGHITLRALRENGQVIVDVTDTGCGVDARHLPHLFDRLYRVDADRSSRLGGAGLGLAIVKSIAQSHGGSVAIKSELGKGTCVTLQFPAGA
jgi:two-component system heavy metal sensor histidine kinase CusS